MRPAGDERHGAEHGGGVLHLGRRLEDRRGAEDEVDAGDDHRRCVDESGDRRGALHRVRQPRVERKLRRLRHRAPEQAERDERCHRRAQAADLGEDRLELERPRLLDEEEERERECRIPTAFMMNAFFAAATAAGRSCSKPIRRYDERPTRPQAGQEDEEIAAFDEQQHREDEERHVAKEAALLVDLVHVAERVADDERADAGDDEHHEDGELIDVDLEAEVEVAGREPAPRRRGLRTLGLVAREHLEEAPDGGGERAGHRRCRDQTRCTAGDRVAEQRDRECPGEREKEADPAGGDHPRRVVSRSVSSATWRRAMADDEAQPDDDLGRGNRHHGEREDLPVERSVLAGKGDQREVGRVQHQLERDKMISGLRRRSTPSAPTVKRKAAMARYQRRTPRAPASGRCPSLLRKRRAWLPRMTPPTAATSSTIDVISNASRWSVRNSLPISAGLPNAPAYQPLDRSPPPAWTPMTTSTSTRIAAAAAMPADVWIEALPPTGRRRPPTYAITNEEHDDDGARVDRAPARLRRTRPTAGGRGRRARRGSRSTRVRSRTGRRSSRRQRRRRGTRPPPRPRRSRRGRPRPRLRRSERHERLL